MGEIGEELSAQNQFRVAWSWGPMTSKNALAFLFDLDGTLVDSVYQHVLAWREALESCGIELAVWASIAVSA
jgi:hypothetical protein